MRSKSRLLVALGFSASIVSGTAIAQSVAPGFAPGTISPITPLSPTTLPRVSPGLAAPAPAPKAPAGPSVTHRVRELAIDGMTAYSVADLRPLLAGLTGDAVPDNRIEAARAAIVARYREDGFVYTAVNATLTGDRLRLAVTEGRIADVKLDGNIGPAGTQVLRFLNHLLDERPIRVSTLERWLLLAGDVPGVTVRSVLNPTDSPGDLLLIAQVSRQAISGLLSADNRAFRSTGPEESLAIVDLNSFTEFGDRTELSFYRTFNNTQVFGQASTEVFLGGSGLKARIYAGSGDAAPSGSLRAIGYNGTTTVFGAQLSYPLIRSREQTLNLVASADALESEIKTFSGTGSRARASFDSLRILRAGADYSLLDTLAGSSRAATDGVVARVSQGLPSLGASRNGYQFAPRTKEQTDFTKVNGQLSRDQPLFRPYEDATVSLLGTVIGQATGTILPPEEKFYLGGPHFNRGYYYGQITGDNALVASAELRLDTPLPFQIPFVGTAGQDVSAQFYGFYDWGETWENQKSDLNRILRSTGAGVRLKLTQYVEVDLEGVYRLTRFPTGRGPFVSGLPSSAVYWQVVGRF